MIMFSDVVLTCMEFIVQVQVYRHRKDYQQMGTWDGRLDFHAAPELWGIYSSCSMLFTPTETIRTIRDGELPCASFALNRQ